MGYSDLKFPKTSLFLVTGCAGFIGSNICEAILNMGYSVRGVDDLSTGHRKNMASFCDNPEFEFVQGDVKDMDVCLKASEGARYVLHQAAWGSVPRSIEMPVFYCANNILGTVNMLEASRRNGVKKFVYASSSSVYGEASGNDRKEGVEGVLLSPYAVSKHSCEEWAKQYTMHYGLETYGLRYFGVFGKRQDPDSLYAAVIPKFIKQLLGGEKPTIYGDGLQSRDFTYIENVVEANLCACLADTDAAGQVYNIAYGKSERIIDVFYKIAEALGTDTEPEFGSRRAGDITHSRADITKAKNCLGYSPEWDFERGIMEAIDWYKKAF